jgi:hypothetical protein
VPLVEVTALAEVDHLVVIAMVVEEKVVAVAPRLNGKVRAYKTQRRLFLFL